MKYCVLRFDMFQERFTMMPNLLRNLDLHTAQWEAARRNNSTNIKRGRMYIHCRQLADGTPDVEYAKRVFLYE